MAVKSIIEIDVKDEKFKAFQALFAKYQKDLSKMPAAWAKANPNANGADFQKLTTQTGLLWRNLAGANKAHDDLNKGARDSKRHFGDLVSSTGNIAKNVANTTFQLLKWAALGGIVGLATTGFGMRGLGESATEQRRKNLAYGLNPGELKSTQVNLGNYFDVNAALGGINESEHDLGKRSSLMGLGVRDFNQSPAAILQDILPKMIERFKAAGMTKQFYDAYGYGNTGIGMDELSRMARLPSGEIGNAIGQTRADTNKYAQPDSELASYQKMLQDIDSAGETIKKSIMDAMLTLTPAVGDFSKSIAKFIDDASRSGEIAGFIDQARESLTDFVKYLSSGEARKDAGDFLLMLHKLAHPFETAGASVSDAATNVGQWLLGHGAGSGKFTNEFNPNAVGVVPNLSSPTKGADPTNYISRPTSVDIADPAMAARVTALLKKYDGDASRVMEDLSSSSKGKMNPIYRDAASDHSRVSVRIDNRTGADVNTTINQAGH